jgi:hypothetical protein
MEKCNYYDQSKMTGLLILKYAFDISISGFLIGKFRIHKNISKTIFSVFQNFKYLDVSQNIKNYHMLKINITSIKKDNRYWQECEEIETTYIVGGDIKWFSHFGRLSVPQKEHRASI